ncbi:bifunctional folylpolyglutamate synthase/dihydrofolate synthase [Naasia lichenicola]|uniref:tetrahydrofolate synthase n=1 Tax=Naasia lichenicola TaxID=2565933 RepID=A0A4S4FG65_9MICO|nr:bifunctional folylpolyglutamate synthase/dihydrofolate synthase [Naasia lichenicola]
MPDQEDAVPNDSLSADDRDRDDRDRDDLPDDGLDGVDDPFDGGSDDDFRVDNLRVDDSDRDDLKPVDEDADEYRELADEVYEELLQRLGEGSPQPRLEPVRRVVELLGDPHRAYPIVHITGTNGKTSTSRMIESLLRAHELSTGLLTSPHLARFSERILINGEPISDERLVANWRDIEPYIAMIDAGLEEADEPAITYFEAIVILAFASFADAPVDVAVIEVGMGGEWDATNVADGQVAVFAPIALDHEKRLGATVAEIARTKSGIIKPLASVVSAAQDPSALAELERAVVLSEAHLAVEGIDFGVDSTVAVGGQLLTIRGRAGTYSDVFLPLYGAHQAHNAALAVAAVESFLGDAGTALAPELVVEGLGAATSPGRLQLVGVEPSVLVDAAHNPHGAVSLAEALQSYFTFDRITAVVGILEDKDADGMIRAMAPIVDRFIVTTAPSDRTTDAETLADLVIDIVGEERVSVEPYVRDALLAARESAKESANGAVVVFGSITLVGQAMEIAAAESWK